MFRLTPTEYIVGAGLFFALLGVIFHIYDSHIETRFDEALRHSVTADRYSAGAAEVAGVALAIGGVMTAVLPRHGANLGYGLTLVMLVAALAVASWMWRKACQAQSRGPGSPTGAVRPDRFRRSRLRTRDLPCPRTRRQYSRTGSGLKMNTAGGLALFYAGY